MIDTVIFDMDGLLINSEVLWYKVFTMMVEPFGKEITLQHYVQNYGGKTIVENMKDLIKEYDLPYTTEEAVVKIVGYEDAEEEKGVPCQKGAYELLTFLKENNYKVVLGTSSRRERAINVLTQNKIVDYFQSVVAGDQVKNGKPAPDIFLKACETVGSKPENCLVLEDSESGILAAKNANMKVICIPDLKQPSQERREMCEDILPDLSCVINYLKNED